jgi:branched-chain amino acid transport system substrate-binding protein
MHDNQTFSVGLAEDTKKGLQPKIDAGEVEIVYYDGITPGESDYTVPLTKLRETNPDIFYFTGYFPEAGLIIRQARNIGITCPFVGGDAALNDEFIKIAGLEMAKGCLMTQEALLKDLLYPEAEEFREAYKAKYGEIPSSPWAVYAADALNVIAYAIDQTGSIDSDVLVDYLKNKLENFPGITGPIAFNEIGDRVGTGISLYVVTDEGGFEIYHP